MDLYSAFQSAKQGDEDSVLMLYNKFKHTIIKYGRNLNYDTAETDMTIRFLEFIKNTDFENLNLKCDGAVVNYAKKFFANTYINLMYAKKKQKNTVYLNDENSFIQDIPYYDDHSCLKSMYFLNLTDLQKKVIIYKYIYGYSEKEIAQKMHISRQAVNRAKNRGVKAITNIYFDS